MPVDHAWLSSLDPELGRQREAIVGLLDVCQTSATVSSFSVGCSIGRGAADALSDVDAVVGVATAKGAQGAGELRAVADAMIAFLPRLGGLIDILRQESASGEFVILRIFAQYDDRLQLDLAVVAEAEVRRGDAAPDFVRLYETTRSVTRRGVSASEVSGDQIRDWSFLGWRALLDADKYLRRGSLWEVHHRLNEARHWIWVLWAAAHHATYPWHGLSQVLDHDPAVLPIGIEATVSDLDPAALRSALSANADVLGRCSAEAVRARGGRLPHEMAGYVLSVLRA